LKQLANRVGSLNLWTESAASTALNGLLAPVKAAAQELAILQDPGHLYLRCVSCSIAR
jgi:protease-4